MIALIDRSKKYKKFLLTSVKAKNPTDRQFILVIMFTLSPTHLKQYTVSRSKHLTVNQYIILISQNDLIDFFFIVFSATILLWLAVLCMKNSDNSGKETQKNSPYRNEKIYTHQVFENRYIRSFGMANQSVSSNKRRVIVRINLLNVLFHTSQISWLTVITIDFLCLVYK